MQWKVIISFIIIYFCKATEVYHSSPELLEKWLGFNIDTTGKSLPELRRIFLSRAKKVAQAYLDDNNYKADLKDNEYPYFGFVPPYVNAIIPGGDPITWENSCFKKNTASATLVNDTITIKINVEKPTSLLCNDFYLFGTTEGFALEDYNKRGDHSFKWSLTNKTAMQKWDVLTNGIRVFAFINEKLKTIGDVVSTFELFIGELTKEVPDYTEKKNVDFLQKYTQMSFPKRTIGNIIINESDIHSGDAFFLTRMDGLDPMLTWATGGSGHSTMLIWMDKELYVVESTVKDSYWPTDGIQKTPYRQWLKQSEEASMNIVYVPLKKEYRDKFDEAAAIKYFESLEGFDYGYYNFLFGWIDTVKNNYPCLPPNYTQCLQWEHLIVLFGVIEGYAPNVTIQMVGQAMNHRVGTKGDPLANILKTAHDKNIPANTLTSIVELDEWQYETHRNGKPAMGPSLVCSVFVCSMWKAAGLFKDVGDNVNCTELVPWDDTALDIFEKDISKLPSVCQNITKPGQPCQVMGVTQIPVLGYGTRSVHAHMYEKCPSLAPKYEKPADC